VPPVWILTGEGDLVVSRRRLESLRRKPLRGEHGYDPSLASMRGILIAQGPSFNSDGEVIAPVENVHIYNLMCAALKLAPAPNDGDDRLVRAFLRQFGRSKQKVAEASSYEKN
jgi:hypothetical protein